MFTLVSVGRTHGLLLTNRIRQKVMGCYSHNYITIYDIGICVSIHIPYIWILCACMRACNSILADGRERDSFAYFEEVAMLWEGHMSRNCGQPPGAESGPQMTANKKRTSVPQLQRDEFSQQPMGACRWLFPPSSLWWMAVPLIPGLQPDETLTQANLIHRNFEVINRGWFKLLHWW